jgi:hypothetical protein
MAKFVCGDPLEIDTAWMAQALEEGGESRGATLLSCEMTGFVGTGQMARNARFRLEWDQPGRLASVVGKFPSADLTAKTTGFAQHNYLTEWAFYAQVARTVTIRTPRCYVARFDDVDPDFVLIMEDMAESRQGDQLAGLSVDEAAIAVAEVVGLHAPKWGDPSLKEFVPGRPQGEAYAGMLGGLYDMTMEPMLARLGSRLDPDVVVLIEAFRPFATRWAQGVESPRTLIHVDYRPDNFMFGVEPGAPPLTVVDWQTATDGNALIDVAYCLGACMPPDTRAAVEGDMLKDYVARMQAAGVKLDFDTAWHDYRHASLWGLAMAVIATVLAAETERGNDMLTRMAQYHGRHALDLDALALFR